MDAYTKLAQAGGKASKGGAVTNYTVPLKNFPQPQIPGKTPFKSRTCSDMPAAKK